MCHSTILLFRSSSHQVKNNGDASDDDTISCKDSAGSDIYMFSDFVDQEKANDR